MENFEVLEKEYKKLLERITKAEKDIRQLNEHVVLINSRIEHGYERITESPTTCFICKNNHVLVLCNDCNEKVCINCSINMYRKSSNGRERCFHYCTNCK